VIRDRLGMLAISAAVAVSAVAVVAVAATVRTSQPGIGLPGNGGRSGAYSSGAPHPVKHPVHAVLSRRPLGYLGVYEPDAPQSYNGVEQFARAAGRQPNIALYYSGWGEPFQARFADDAKNHAALPFVQLDPATISLRAIAAGKYDAYLTSYAEAVADYGRGVIIGFGHEMNGPWYSWGYGRTSPSTFIQAWRHIVTLFRAQGADNVTWLWSVSKSSAQTGNPANWWPGSHYVTWVGIDGYYYKPGDTFASVFEPTIRLIRQFTSKPVILGETAVGPDAGRARGIQNLFTGLREQRDLGFVWFDKSQHHGIYHQDWRLEDSPAAEAEFKKETATWQEESQAK
jgi:mannan endo-1,4-beta-mannosidase